MKTHIAKIFVVLFPICTNASPFQNLDFESPRLPVTIVGGCCGLGSDAFPGWNLYSTVPQPTQVFLNTAPLSGAYISLFGPLEEQTNPNHDIYSAHLYSGFFNGGQQGSVLISQAGQIPLDAKSLRLEAKIFQGYSVTLDGFPIAMTLSTSGTEYDTYYGDISSFSGKTAELKIETAVGPGFLDGGPYMFIQEVGFSSLAVPEPSTWALLGFGLFGLICHTRRARSR